VDQINYSEEGRPRTKAVIPEDGKWANQMTEIYKRFLDSRQKLRTLDKQINHAIDELETRIVQRAARERNYVITCTFCSTIGGKLRFIRD